MIADDAAAGWRVMAAKATGSSHAKTGLPCQDAFAVRACAGGPLIAAIADGAGSAPAAATGAALAVDAALCALELLAADLPATDVALDQALRGVLRAAFFALVTHADAAATPLTHFHTTLSCLLVTEEVTLVAQVGDGAVTLVHADGRLELALPPRHGEYANSTFFVTQYPSLPAAGMTRIVRAPIIGGLLTTDGLIELAYTDVYRACVPFVGFMAPLFHRLSAPGAADLDAKLRAFLDRPLIRDKTSDDLSVIMALRAGLALPPLYVPAPAAPALTGEPDRALPSPATDPALTDSPAEDEADLAAAATETGRPLRPAPRWRTGRFAGPPPMDAAEAAPPEIWQPAPTGGGEPRRGPSAERAEPEADDPAASAPPRAVASGTLSGTDLPAVAGDLELGAGAPSAASTERLADPVLAAAPGPPAAEPRPARTPVRRPRRRR